MPHMYNDWPDLLREKVHTEAALFFKDLPSKEYDDLMDRSIDRCMQCLDDNADALCDDACESFLTRWEDDYEEIEEEIEACLERLLRKQENPFEETPGLREALQLISFEDLLDELKDRIEKYPEYAAELAYALLKDCRECLQGSAIEKKKKGDFTGYDAYRQAADNCARATSVVKALFEKLDLYWSGQRFKRKYVTTEERDRAAAIAFARTKERQQRRKQQSV